MNDKYKPVYLRGSFKKIQPYSSPEDIKSILRVLNALCDIKRFNILECLCLGGAQTLKKICSQVHLSQVKAKEELLYLRKIWLVVATKEKTTIYYSVKDESVFFMIDLLRKIFCRKISQSFLKKCETKKILMPEVLKVYIIGLLKTFASYNKYRILDFLVKNSYSRVTFIINTLKISQATVGLALRSLFDDECVTLLYDRYSIYYNICRCPVKVIIVAIQDFFKKQHKGK